MRSRAATVLPQILAASAVGLALVAQAAVQPRGEAWWGWALFVAAGAVIALARSGLADTLPAGPGTPAAPPNPLRRAVWGAAALALSVAATALATTNRLPLPALGLWAGGLVAASLAVGGWRVAPAARGSTPWTRGEITLVAVLVLAAVAARTLWLPSVPPYYFGDEPRVGIYLQRVYGEGIPNFFSLGWNTWPVIGLSLQGLFAPVIGLHTTALRASSALMGTLAVLMTYLLARELFSPRAALLAAALLAVCRTALDLSRLGICHAQVMFFESLAFYLWWRAVHSGAAWHYLSAGIALGLCYYTYNAGQLAAPIWVAWIGLSAAAAPRAVRTHWRGAVLTAGGFALTTLPLALHITDRFTFGPNWTQWTYMSRNRQTLTQIVDAWHAHGISDALARLAEQAWPTWLGFSLIPAQAYRLGYRGGGMLDDVTGALLVLGLLLAVSRLLRPPYAFLLLWWGATTVAGGVLTDAPPAFVRLVGLLPAVAILAALPLALLVDSARGAPVRRAVGAVAAAALLAAATGANAYTYFVRFPRQEFDPMSELAHYLARVPPPASTVLLGAEHFLHFSHEEIFSLDFAERQRTDIGEVAQFFPVHQPTGDLLAVVLGPTQLSLEAYVRSLYPAAAAADVVRGDNHTLLFRTVEIPPDAVRSRTGLRRAAGTGDAVGDPFGADAVADDPPARWSGQVYWPRAGEARVEIESERPVRIDAGGEIIALPAAGTREATVDLPRGWLPVTIDERDGGPRRLRIRVRDGKETFELTRWDLRPDAVWNGLRALYENDDGLAARTIEPQVNLFAVETFLSPAALPIRAPFRVAMRGALLIDYPGAYTLELSASGPHRLQLDGETLVDVADVVPEEPRITSVRRELAAGRHPISVHYDCTRLAHTTRRVLQLHWTPPGQPRALIPPTHFVPVEDLPTARRALAPSGSH